MTATKSQPKTRARTARKAITEAVATAAPVERIKLAGLERRLTAAFREQGVTEPTQEQIAALGDPIVEAGELVGYTSARYGQGRWVSSAVLRRVAKALASDAE